MARELVLDVVAKKNSRQLSELATEFERLSKQTDDFGKKLNNTGKFSQFVDQELAKTKQLAKELGQEFERTGNQDLFAKMRGAQSNAKALERIKADLAKSLEDGGNDGGRRANTSFVKEFIGSFKGAGSTELIAALSVWIASASPAIAAAVNAGVLGGIATGGLALGIVGQVRSPDVKSAFADAGKGIVDGLVANTTSFHRPLIEAAHIFSQSIQDAIRSIDFGKLSQLVVPLSRGFGGMLTNAMPGVNQAIGAGIPILKELAHFMPILGNEVSKMFAEFAKGGKGALEAFRALEIFIIGVIRIAGFVVERLSSLFANLVEWASKVAHFMAEATKAWPAMHKFFEELANRVDQVKNGFEQAGDKSKDALSGMGNDAKLTTEDLSALNAKISETEVTASTLAGAMAGKVFDTMMSVDQATLHWHESLTGLQEAFNQNGRSLDENTAKGQANREAILGAVTANMQQYQAQIAAGMSAIDAAAAYDANTAALERQLRKAGLTQQQIDGLIGKYKAVPDQVNTDIAMHGLTDAINNLGSLLAKLNNLDGRDFGFTVTETDIRRRINEDMGHVASGGPVVGGHPYLVGEERPEIFVPNTSGYIVPQARNQAASSGGTWKHVLEIAGNADSQVGAFLAALLQRGAFTIKSQYIVG